MDTADIKLFLKIKKQRRLARRLTAFIFVLLLAELGLMVFTGTRLPWLMPVLWASVGGVALAAFNEWMNGPQDELLDLVERQISREPDALLYLSRHRAA